jgi:hypothetical protein
MPAQQLEVMYQKLDESVSAGSLCEPRLIEYLAGHAL